jgi:hypothetical protein
MLNSASTEADMTLTKGLMSSDDVRLAEIADVKAK